MSVAVAEAEPVAAATWADVRAAFRALAAATSERQRHVETFRRAALAAPEPAHLQLVLRELRHLAEGRPPDSFDVLDHGCGGGLSVFYLRALGYDARGVDLGPGDTYAALNAAAGADVLQVFDGRALPFPDARFDAVISQQVLEHVGDPVVETYYAEEGRVLKPGGIALHQVPHCLVPYDSHTRTWFYHWLPRAVRDAIYRSRGIDPGPLGLRYRMPGFHRRRVERHIGPCRDLTLDRLRQVRDFGDGVAYDGPRRLRRLVERIIDAPLVGGAAGALIRKLVMIDTIAVKRGAGTAAPPGAGVHGLR